MYARDKQPIGARGESRPDSKCAKAGSRAVLGLRDILDERRVLRSGGTPDAKADRAILRRSADLWRSAVFDPVSAYEFPPALAR